MTRAELREWMVAYGGSESKLERPCDRRTWLVTFYVGHLPWGAGSILPGTMPMTTQVQIEVPQSWTESLTVEQFKDYMERFANSLGVVCHGMYWEAHGLPRMAQEWIENHEAGKEAE